MILLGQTGYGAFTEAVVHDLAIAALRRRVHVTEDLQMTAVVPRLKPARVTVTLQDGRQSTHLCESARGDFQCPSQESEVRGKFHELAGLVLTAAGSAAVEQAVHQCDQWPSVHVLTDLLRRHSRPEEARA